MLCQEHVTQTYDSSMRSICSCFLITRSAQDSAIVIRLAFWSCPACTGHFGGCMTYWPSGWFPGHAIESQTLLLYSAGPGPQLPQWIQSLRSLAVPSDAKQWGTLLVCAAFTCMILPAVMHTQACVLMSCGSKLASMNVCTLQESLGAAAKQIADRNLVISSTWQDTSKQWLLHAPNMLYNAVLLLSSVMLINQTPSRRAVTPQITGLNGNAWSVDQDHGSGLFRAGTAMVLNTMRVSMVCMLCSWVRAA